MNKYHICIAQLPGDPHSDPFIELAELLAFSLRELNCSVDIQRNRIDSSARNIILGVHLLAPEQISSLPRDSIIINTEQLKGADSQFSRNALQWFSSGFEVWDYSRRNIDHLHSLGLPNIRRLRIGYQQQLRRLELAPACEVEALFYGGLNDRRRGVLQRIHDSGVKLKVLVGIYGEQRDRWIEKSRVVLNCHFYEAQIFEIVRVFYLLTNAVAVVGELNSGTDIDEELQGSILASTYEDMPIKVRDMVREPETVEYYRKKGFEIISQRPQSAYMKELISS
jgi:hypothetical protein